LLDLGHLPQEALESPPAFDTGIVLYLGKHILNGFGLGGVHLHIGLNANDLRELDHAGEVALLPRDRVVTLSRTQCFNRRPYASRTRRGCRPGA
jgi:hypothetical protein